MNIQYNYFNVRIFCNILWVKGVVIKYEGNPKICVFKFKVTMYHALTLINFQKVLKNRDLESRNLLYYNDVYEHESSGVQCKL